MATAAGSPSPRPSPPSNPRRGEGEKARVVRGCAAAAWRVIEAQYDDPAERAAALAAMLDGFADFDRARQAARWRWRQVTLRAVRFRRLLVATENLPAAVRARAAQKLAAQHPDVAPSAMVRALGFAGAMALARVRTAPEYDLPPGRFELGSPLKSDRADPAGRSAIVLAPGWPRALDLIAVPLDGAGALRLDGADPVIPAPRSSLARRTQETWTVHVHPAAWASARAAAVLDGGVSADAVPLLIGDPAAVEWSRRGALGAAKTLDVVDALPGDPADPVHAIWRAMAPATRRAVTIRTPARAQEVEARP